jgi:hypothetical protein
MRYHESQHKERKQVDKRDNTLLVEEASSDRREYHHINKEELVYRGGFRVFETLKFCFNNKANVTYIVRAARRSGRSLT